MNRPPPREEFMRMALRLARRGAGKVSPNPMVGAVVVRDGEVVATGYHHGAGMEHAEVDALRKLGFDAHGCDMYVNLEPCCHHGRTPPCTDRIREAGVARVIVGMIDPNPLVSGKGVRALRDRGVEVVEGMLKREAGELNAAFVKWITTGLPHVTLKLAATLDGRTADRFQGSRWVSSARSRRVVHRMRSTSDVVMVGAGTAAADDPLLLPVGVRGGGVPLRAVVDEGASLEPDSRLVRSIEKSGVLLFTTTAATRARTAALAAAGVSVVELDPGPDGLVPLQGVMAELGRRQALSVLVEGGSILSAGLLSAGLVDRLVLFTAPRLLGDPKARPLVGDLGIRTMDETMNFVIVRSRRVGPDLMTVLEPVVSGRE